MNPVPFTVILVELSGRTMAGLTLDTTAVVPGVVVPVTVGSGVSVGVGPGGVTVGIKVAVGVGTFWPAAGVGDTPGISTAAVNSNMSIRAVNLRMESSLHLRGTRPVEIVGKVPCLQHATKPTARATEIRSLLQSRSAAHDRPGAARIRRVT
jgi:hypothetical protein